MSGIVGLCRMDGEPVDRGLLERLTESLTFRGPDAHQVWVQGPVGLGHALLRTTPESLHESQPATLDGQVWICADARIDGWQALKAALLAAGRNELDAADDALLILHAYHAWGEDCVRHLIGDFAFAIWDGTRQRLFCARDQVGVKPFFYARVGETLAISNTLDCLRHVPGVSSDLNDLAIADFLLFGANQETDTTSFRAIMRLPAGNRLTWSRAGLVVSEYWRLPVDRPVEYRAANDYVAQFNVLLEQAVSDRLRTRCAGVELSGGMDSGSIAAIAHELLARSSEAFDLHAQSTVYDHLIPDQERKFAARTAAELGIPVDFLVADDFRLFEGLDRPESRTPEPNPDPVLIRVSESFRRASLAGRVMFTGWEGDGFLNESPRAHFSQLLHSGAWLRLAGELAGHAWGRRRYLFRSFLDRVRKRFSPGVSPPSEFPEWINPELDQRLGLRARWEQRWKSETDDVGASAHPRAHLTLAQLTRTFPLFESYDPGATGVPVEYRHPLLDLRLLDFYLSLPPYPWCVGKHILREAMRGRLPESVRQRPKTALAGFPYMRLLAAQNLRPFSNVVANAALSRYVMPGRLPALSGADDPDTAWINFRPYCLNFWFAHGWGAPRVQLSEMHHEQQ